MKLFRRCTLMAVPVMVIIILICMMIPRTESRMMNGNGYSYLPPSDNGKGDGNGNGGPPIGIIKLDGKLNKDGSYMYEYETENGITAEESGYPKDVPGAKHPAIVAMGSFSYVSPEGKPITLTYTADEKGFHPQGEHLPTPPPIPPEIAEALAHLPPCDGAEEGGEKGGYIY